MALGGGSFGPMDTVPGLRVERPLDGVVLLTFDRPERYNALDHEMITGLPLVLDSIASDPTARAVVLTGAGAAFCAGADLEVVERLSGIPPAELEPLMARVMRTPVILRGASQPTIAAINGPAAGGGLGVALACDIRIAAHTAHFSSPFIRMALVPDLGVSWLLPHVAGESRALEMMLTGRRVDATEARAMGLVTSVVDDPLACALELAATLAEMPPGALARTKKMALRAAAIGLDEAVGEEARQQSAAVRSGDFGERFAQWQAAVIDREVRP